LNRRDFTSQLQLHQALHEHAVWLLGIYQTYQADRVSHPMFGREVRILLELFKYIIAEPESSQILLAKLQAVRIQETNIVEGLVF
jgi:hypothetical protein